MSGTNKWFIQEDIILMNDGSFMINCSVNPRTNKQVWEDILQKQKEFASEIYLQRDKEKWL